MLTLHQFILLLISSFMYYCVTKMYGWGVAVSLFVVAVLVELLKAFSAKK